MVLTGKKLKYFMCWRGCVSATFFTLNSTGTGFELNLHLCSQMLLTNAVRHGTTAKLV
jgi:hypothetical protein